MRHVLGFLVIVFAGLFAAQFLKNSRETSRDARPVLRVFGPSSFVSQWGPGPWLKQEFEKTCDCRVEFIDGADSTILFQRVKSETRSGTDVVVGMDQYDLETASTSFEWREIDHTGLNFETDVRPALGNKKFVPYDWGILAFVVRKSENQQLPNKLDDLLAPEWAGQIAMEDPRTSSPGLQFLLWLIQAKGEDAAFEYLKKFNKNVKSYAASWSMAYGLFTKRQVKAAFSYVTSPVFHLVEDKDSDVVALEFQEGHVVQFEYAGIPEQCRQCALAEKFVRLLLSAEGQKLVMEKNYMFPVIQGVRNGTPFMNIPPFRTLDLNLLPSLGDRERILKKWSALRRME